MPLPQFDPNFPYDNGTPTTGPSVNSPTDLRLSQVPDVEDSAAYDALLEIHNALYLLLGGSDAADSFMATFVTKARSTTLVTSDYTVLVTDGTVEVDASLGPVTITAHKAADGIGFRNEIKRIDKVPANKVTLVGDGAELIDGHVSGIRISTLSSYTIKSNGIGWNII